MCCFVLLFSSLSFLFFSFCKKTEGRSKESKDLVRRLLSKRHAERPTCDQALEHSWFTDLQAQLRVRSNPDNIATLAKVKILLFVCFSFHLFFCFFLWSGLSHYYMPLFFLFPFPFPFPFIFLFLLFLFFSFVFFLSTGW